MVMAVNTFRLDGKTALVTGGGGGLGLAVSRALGVAGARVVVLGRNIEKLDKACRTLEEAGVEALPRACDVLDPAAAARAVAEIEAQVAPIDILVNNAGIQHRAPALDVASGDWSRIIDTNLSAPFRMTQLVARSMSARQAGGKIINILSVLADLGRPSVVPYAASKGGLKMLTRALAVEWGPLGIQVNGIAPGYFATEMNTALVEDAAFCDWLSMRTPMRRWGRAEEVGPAAVFLASAASSFVTGQVLTVDGGFTSAA